MQEKHLGCFEKETQLNTAVLANSNQVAMEAMPTNIGLQLGLGP